MNAIRFESIERSRAFCTISLAAFMFNFYMKNAERWAYFSIYLFTYLFFKTLIACKLYIHIYIHMYICSSENRWKTLYKRLLCSKNFLWTSFKLLQRMWGGLLNRRLMAINKSVCRTNAHSLHSCSYLNELSIYVGVKAYTHTYIEICEHKHMRTQGRWMQISSMKAHMYLCMRIHFFLVSKKWEKTFSNYVYYVCTFFFATACRCCCILFFMQPLQSPFNTFETVHACVCVHVCRFLLFVSCNTFFIAFEYLVYVRNFAICHVLAVWQHIIHSFIHSFSGKQCDAFQQLHTNIHTWQLI